VARLILLLLATLLLGCPPQLRGNDDDAATDDDDDAATDDDDATSDDDDASTDDDDAVDPPPPVDDDDDGPELWMLERCEPDPTLMRPEVSDWEAAGPELWALLEYSGGCEPHYFQLCWDGAADLSDPPGVTLWVRDLGPPDPCKSLITEKAVWNLDLLWEAVGATGEIQVTLGGQTRVIQF